MSYKNLVFEGGGVLGVAYVGSLAVLQEHNMLADVERVAGASAGSIVAMLMAVGYSTEEIHTVMHDLDFADFKDDPCVLRLGTEYGYYKGQFALEFFQGLVEKKLGSKDATFSQLRESKGLDLKVFGTNLSTHSSQEFSWDASPDMSIALAVRISMSIPFFFAAINIDGDIFADGGTVFNNPISIFDGEPEDETLGFRFEYSDQPREEKFGNDHFFKYVKNLFETILETQSAFYTFSPEEQKESISIPTDEISPVDFELDTADKDRLIASGRQATETFLAKQG